MKAWVSLSVGEFNASRPSDVVGWLAREQLRHFKGEASQGRAWDEEVAILHAAVRAGDPNWHLLLEFDLHRIEKRIDAVLITDRAILPMEFKVGADRFEPGDARQAEDYGLDLHDFHAGSRGHPVVPILVATQAMALAQTLPLTWGGVSQVLFANKESLGPLISAVQAAIGTPSEPLQPNAWEDARYQPVPTITEAAISLYGTNTVADLTAARAEAPNLNRTTSAIARAVEAAQRDRAHTVVFVTGIPGAGKTLCGLNVVFGALRNFGAVFLTGNVPLVTVLRESLARDAAERYGISLAEARSRVATALQNVHSFLAEYVTKPLDKPEPMIVFDEAQRAWDQRQATRDTLRRRSILSRSEPAHTLEVMGRHDDWSVVVALIGNGQEINSGEAGLREWGKVIGSSATWRAVAAPRVITATKPAQRLGEGGEAWLTLDPDLDLTVPLRSVRDAAAAPWVEFVLDGDAGKAREKADKIGGVPIFLTRDLEAMRTGLRALCRGLRRPGIVASAGAKRLRAEGLGVQVPNVADWFLNRWDDVRGSDALETFATEYDCQGLELDVVGLAWGGDFVRGPNAKDGWTRREFRGDEWTVVRAEENLEFITNTYRVLLTRARYETIIWVPRGSEAGGEFYDKTRPAAEMDAVANFLTECGARALSDRFPTDPEPDSIDIGR